MTPTIQFCQGEDDITSQMYASDDADQVRLWDADQQLMLLCVDKADSVWTFGSSDTLVPGAEQLQATYGTWQEALESFGFQVPEH